MLEKLKAQVGQNRSPDHRGVKFLYKLLALHVPNFSEML